MRTVSRHASHSHLLKDASQKLVLPFMETPQRLFCFCFLVLALFMMRRKTGSTQASGRILKPSCFRNAHPASKFLVNWIGRRSTGKETGGSLFRKPIVHPRAKGCAEKDGNDVRKWNSRYTNLHCYVQPAERRCSAWWTSGAKKWVRKGKGWV